MPGNGTDLCADSHPLPLRLLLDLAPGHGCLAHIPTLPGLCFRADDLAAVQAVAIEHAALYGRWLLAQGIPDLTPEAAALVRRLRAGTPSPSAWPEGTPLSGVEILETERRLGSPVWLSGNPAVLFEHDRRPLTQAVVAAHMRFARAVLACIGRLVVPLSDAQLAQKLTPRQRSIDETLVHIGNCLWWYCSRIDDNLPEPADPSGLRPMDRCDRLLAGAAMLLKAVPSAGRAVVHIPRRFPTADPDEAWTHAKVCRRQAEHVWEHLPGIRRAVENARQTDT